MSARIFQTLKKHPAVVPVFVITIGGAAFAGVQILRASNYYTDVSFRRKSNPHPYENVKPNQNFKFIHSSDYSKVKQGDRPDYTK